MELLVIAHQLKLLHGETLEASRDLIHVQLVVVLYRKHNRLSRLLGALGRGAYRPGRGAQQSRGRLREGAHARLGALGGLLGARSVAREGGIEELRVGLPLPFCRGRCERGRRTRSAVHYVRHPTWPPPSIF